MDRGNAITLQSEVLNATINPTGAQLTSMATRDGREILWHGDPEFWPDHAPILFPLIGPLTNQILRHKGNAYSIPAHGFAQSRQFDVSEQSENHCTLTTSDTPETQAMYPFSFQLAVSYTLTDGELSHVMTVSNTGDEPLPCDVGFHPGFQWPLTPDVPKEDYQITFDRDEPGPIRRGIDDPIFLYGEPHPTPVQGRELALSDDLFIDQAIVFDRLWSRSLTYHSGSGDALRIDFPDSPYLALWMRPGATYIAIEPWQGLPAEYGWDGEFSAKPGIAILSPGEVRSWRLVVTLFDVSS